MGEKFEKYLKEYCQNKDIIFESLKITLSNS